MNNFEKCLLNSSLSLFDCAVSNDEPRPKEVIESDLSLRDKICYNILGCHYEKVLTELDELVKEISINTWGEEIETILKLYIKESEGNKLVRQEIVLCYGVTALQLFIQQNYIGPPLPVYLLFPSFLKNGGGTEFRKHVESRLCTNSESLYSLVCEPQLLLLAKIAFEAVKDSDLVTSKWWYFRYLRLYQSSINERVSSSVYRMAISLIEDSLDKFEKLKLEDTFVLVMNVEASIVCSQFGDISRGKKFAEKARELAGLEIEMTGALGARTRFQKINYAQLVLKTSKLKRSSEKSLFEMRKDLPNDVQLQDETLLPQISFLDINDDESLRPEDQAVILALCILKQKSTAQDELLCEELLAFVSKILSKPYIWCFQFSALFLRSQLEKGSSKKVERAMAQLQSLVDEFKIDLGSPRGDLFYCSTIPTFWLVKKELANLLLSLGVIKSALDIFLHLELWEDVIYCYQRLERNNKAKELIIQRLHIKETPTLLCLLGDVTDEPSHYQKAWDLSGARSARAQRSLGFYFFRRKEYEKCIPHFAKAVEICSLDQEVWFSMGHAAAQITDFECAANSFQRLVTLNSESFEAWNNLSNAYIKLGQKPRAWKCLREAIRCNYENWRIWENFFLVSVDIGAFEDALMAWHRLIDLKGKHLDEEVLEILVKAITNDLTDADGRSASFLTGKALELVGRITMGGSNSAKTWYCYAQLLERKPNESAETLERTVHYYQKACRIASQTHGWEKDCTARSEIQNYVRRLLVAYRKCASSLTPERDSAMKQSCRLILKSVIALISRQATNSDESETVIESQIEELKNSLDEIEM